MFIVVSVCWTTWKTPSLSPPLRRGIGRGRGTPVFCHASQEPRNEWNYSWLFSMLTRAQQRGSTKSSSTWRGWLPPGQSWPARRPVTWTRIYSPYDTPPLSGRRCMAEHNDPDEMSCKRGLFTPRGCPCVTTLRRLVLSLMHRGSAVCKWL